MCHKGTGCMQYVINLILVVLCILMYPVIAFADAGVPMIALIIPGFGISLIPIIIIEYFYLKRRLSLKPAKAGAASLISNLVSTVIGVPLTWVALAAIEMFVPMGGRAFGINTLAGKIFAVTVQAPWLIPYENDLNWMVPTAGMVLLVPFFFVSWWIEYLISRKILRDIGAKDVRTAVRNANLITYGLLAFCLCILLISALYSR